MDGVKLTDFEKQAYKTSKGIPRGKVSTYLEIAKAIGRPKSARAVGNALNKNPFSSQVPCHRVVKSNGRVGGFASGVRKKIKMLEKEGIRIENGKVVNFKKVLHKF